MYVRVISFGSNWWAMHPGNADDPFCFRRRAAYFNAAAVRCGRRLHHSAIFAGQVRFNSTSGFDPEFAMRAVGRTFLCTEPTQRSGKCHLLFSRPAPQRCAEASLVTLNSADHGAVVFAEAGWKSPDVQPISISQRAFRYEAMLLMSGDSWVESELGRWQLSASGDRLVLAECSHGAKR